MKSNNLCDTIQHMDMKRVDLNLLVSLEALLVAYSNETGQEFRSLTGRSFQHYTGRVCEAKPDAPSVPGSELIIVGEYWNGQA